MPLRSICDASFAEITNVVLEVEKDDKQTDQLLSHPSAFFEARGFCVPPSARFRTVDTNRLKKNLQTERDVDIFLSEEGGGARASFEVHIGEGKGKCTKIDIT